MRCTCARSTDSCASVPFAASANSVSSGIEFQRKYERRVASSYGVTATVPALRRCRSRRRRGGRGRTATAASPRRPARKPLPAPSPVLAQRVQASRSVWTSVAQRPPIRFRPNSVTNRVAQVRCRCRSPDRRVRSGSCAPWRRSASVAATSWCCCTSVPSTGAIALLWNGPIRSSGASASAGVPVTPEQIAHGVVELVARQPAGRREAGVQRAVAGRAGFRDRIDDRDHAAGPGCRRAGGAGRRRTAGTGAAGARAGTAGRPAGRATRCPGRTVGFPDRP